MNVPLVTVALLGARMHYAVPRILYQHGMLATLFTDSYIGNKPRLKFALSSIPARIRPSSVSRLLSRECAELRPDVVMSDESLGFWYWNALRGARNTATRERIQTIAAQRLAKNVVNARFGGAEIVWGFNTASVELFQAAKKSGIRCVLEQTFLPYALEQRLMDREYAGSRTWQASAEIGSGKRGHIARETAEWGLADLIIAGSTFVAEGLQECGVPSKKIRIVAYGVDTSFFTPGANKPPRNPTSALRVLFVGEVGLRKGAHFLLTALENFCPNEVQAQFAGRVLFKKTILNRFAHIARFLGQVPRSEVPALFDWADVLVLPSIIEGSATVVYEALASGVPVIVTPNVGSIVTDGIEGRVIPIRDSAAISAALRAYIQDPDLLALHTANTRGAIPRASLTRYGDDLVRLFSELGALGA